MGDISEMRGLIVLFTIVALTITLILLIPPEFFTAATNEQNKPDSVNPQNIIAWNQTYSVNASAGVSQTWSMNGYNFWFAIEKTDPFGAYDKIKLATYDSFWIFTWNYDYFGWYDADDNLISVSNELYAETVDLYGTPYQFACKNSKTEVRATIAYNTTAYTDFADACSSTDFSVIFNIDWDDRASSMNALSLISLILTGSMPGVDPVLSIIFGLLSWGIVAAGCYMAFIFVLRIVGAVFGGGGA